MNNSKDFDYLIKKALSEGENKIELDPCLTSEVKSRLISQKGRDKIDMNRIKNILGTRFGKVAAVCCSMVLVLTVSYTFVQPVRAASKESIEKIKSMVYDVIKGKDGKYVAIKVPYREPQKEDNNAYEGVKKAVGKDLISKIPENLAGGYTLDHQALGCYDLKSDSMIMVSSKDGMTKELYDKFNETVSSFYCKEKSQIVLEIAYMDFPFALNSSREHIEGDNKKSLSFGDITATYAEYPGVRYPIKEIDGPGNGDEDRTQKPEITVLHTIKWKQNDAYYTIYDFNGDLSEEELESAAATVIEKMN
ncbi:hypothetical protein [Acetivibrio cellulolyticus]|uniref:hypothetical protein n=1 Tax=Acetivibrio cellulolyticus TaxID=35830 RepID=UPI0001E2C234|nr:hypothetical protein [Acetivibrio cellulolyticus]